MALPHCGCNVQRVKKVSHKLLYLVKCLPANNSAACHAVNMVKQVRWCQVNLFLWLNEREMEANVYKLFFKPC